MDRKIVVLVDSLERAAARVEGLTRVQGLQATGGGDAQLWGLLGQGQVKASAFSAKAVMD